MKTTEELTKELDEVTNKVFEKAKDFSLSLQEDFSKIDIGETTEEDIDKVKSFYGAVAMRQQAVLKRILIDWGGLLFV